MKLKLLALSTVALAASFACADFKGDLQKRLNSYASIIKSRNGNALEKWSKENCAGDFRFVVEGGRPYFLKDWIAEEKESYLHSRNLDKLSFHIDDVIAKGDKAMVRVTATAVFTIKNATGKAETRSHANLLGLQLVKRKGKWLFFEIRQHKE